MIDQETSVTLHQAVVSASGQSTAVDVTRFTGPVAVEVSGIPTAGTPTIGVKLQQGATSTTASTDVVGGSFTALGTNASVQTIVLAKGVLGKFIRFDFAVAGTGSPAHAIYAKITGRASRNPAS